MRPASTTIASWCGRRRPALLVRPDLPVATARRGAEAVVFVPVDPDVRVNLHAPLYVIDAQGAECEVALPEGYADALAVEGWTQAHVRLDLPLCHIADGICFYESARPAAP